MFEVYCMNLTSLSIDDDFSNKILFDFHLLSLCTLTAITAQTPAPEVQPEEFM